MGIVVWVVSSVDSSTIPETEHDTATPAEAIFLAKSYRDRFGEDGFIRIHADVDVSSEELASLHAMAKSNGFQLESVFPS